MQVNGEIDKLSMEEAGFPNCISVPYGLPEQSSKELPAEDEVLTRLETKSDLS